ncbi:Tpo3p [Sugiyamaella lignohabitans]|uniref:Tpo3p n=1 Tax=Sugiyamaella lignohabitans TaxID=796027 RepID=A0A167CK52_9ASCO|nr:Tpo3p [Sugiyamaella lignohabitans]ANB11800.1 Tpo3p [Sugiyamaella lignohabitans]
MNIPTAEKLSDLEKGPEPHPVSSLQDSTGTGTGPSPIIHVKAFEEGDPENPHNFPLSRKLYHTIVLVLFCFTCSMSSAMYTPALGDIEEKYNVTREVALMSTGVLLMGFIIGPIIWSAVNEAFGRWYSWTIGFFLFQLFQIPTGVDPNFRTLLVGRFFQGLFGVSTLVTFGASMSDIWGYKTRGFSAAIAVFSIFAAPALGPFIGSLLVEFAGFGYISWLVMMLGAILLVLNMFVKETAAPVIFHRKAIRMRKEGLNARAPIEEVPPTLMNLATKYCIRPFIMLVEDKALAFLCVYAGISYGLLYTILIALPVTFAEYRHFSFIPTYLPSIAVLVGVVITSLHLCVTNGAYIRAAEKAGVLMLPDQRLKPMMCGAIFLPIGLFIFGWTAPFTNVHWMGPIVGAAIVGYATSIIFIAAIMYMIESYGHFASSAFAANAIIRSMVAVLFLLVFSRMVEAMTLQGAFSFFGGISILIAPGPFILFKYGKVWRSLSKWTP